ncbi:uncharacterized protein LOC111777037 [Cucurbita pepo subsp. pepo]|uniref:uncharacterized protein LOC111777037 n=1 Tax=Cucurbita pepo subsp. pepo TaxID=3664 RepID=UPI000C9D7F25|nr:uncharacterized protein LOC111777037 [Cucurbita pepo subsp. pepo]
MKIFAVSIPLFFFIFSFSVAYSWIFYFSATIHKDYMFFFCNTLLLFLSLNSRSSVADKEQAAGDGRRSVDGEKEMGLLRVQQVSRRLVLQETRDHELEMCSFALEEAHNDELEGMKDDECEHEQEQEQGHRVDTIGLEELNRKCEEFIRRMKEDIRVQILTLQCS